MIKDLHRERIRHEGLDLEVDELAEKIAELMEEKAKKEKEKEKAKTELNRICRVSRRWMDA